jgi:hypothetical protein
MSQILGDFKSGSTVRFMWNTNALDGSAITRGTNGTIRVYKDGGTTELVSPAVTDTEDFDGLTGVHLCEINISNATSYPVGHDYFVVLPGAVIDGKTVNACLAKFSIENQAEVDFLRANHAIADTFGEVAELADVATAIQGAIAEGTTTWNHVMQIALAALGGKSTVSGKYRNQADTKDRIDATVSGGHRTAVTLNLD